MKKCKNCAEKFEPRFSTLEKYCWNSDCKLIEALQKLEQKKKSESKEWSERKSKLKKDLLTKSDYIKMAQQVFNKWIRQRDEGKPCLSCGKKINGVVHASHYFNANNHYNVRFDENNVFSCCYKCNVQLSGNLIEYGVNLEKLIGVDEFTILREKAYETRKFTRDELKEIIIIYKNKLKE
jgi:hypothetical protein